MTKSICFIAARAGSKGVPGKNIRILNGKPLIAHSIEAALDSKIFSSVIVSTEDKKIARIAKEYGAEIPFIRPKKLSTDAVGGEEVLLHGIKKLFSLGYNFDIVQMRDCTYLIILAKIKTADERVSSIGSRRRTSLNLKNDLFFCSINNISHYLFSYIICT